VQTFTGKTECLVLSAELTNSLKSLSKKSGVTLYMTLLAAFSTLLYRYSGQSDLVVGSPIAGRNRSEIEGLIGSFVNTLVLRTRFEGNPSFSELLSQVRQVTLDAYGHQDLPFEKLVAELQPERSLSHSPLFQVMFVLQNAPMGEMSLPGLTLERWEKESVVAKFDLTLSIEETDEKLSTTWEYNTDLFDASTMARMAGHFQTLLESIVADPREQVSVLPLLEEAVKHQMLVEWNDTAHRYPSEKCIHQLFSEQVSRTPDAVAVVFEEEQLTYRELNSRANQLAHYLQELGVGPEVLVGICVERSLEMVVGMLGILKAGGAYVPLDPAYPTERLAYMLSDASVQVLLTIERLVSSLPARDATVVCLDADWESILAAEAIQEHPANEVTPENLAYVIYTSGSTGKPKGVLVTHKGLVNMVFWYQSAFEVSCSDRTTQLAGVAFDVHVWEIWPYLTVGASIYVVNSELRHSPEHLFNWLISQKITMSLILTSLAETLISWEWPENTELRVMLTGGDKLHQYPSASLPFKLANNYGPTENTVVTTSYWVVSKKSNDTSLPIGRPIANTQTYILDEEFQPVPIGVSGELHIGGAGLARGYLNRPELTADKFIPNPFSNEPGARLYKTGDLARYLPDGNIEFLGRIDNQVKIRGFRIELGEIEAVLTQHPEVVQAVVIAREEQSGNKGLVAYLVAREEQLAISDLRSFLLRKLPDYMVPNAFVFLEAMPLTPHGKIDRRALPAPDITNLTSDSRFVAPRTPTEEILATIWSEVLGKRRVGIHDNFFELGGHSLLAPQVISRVREAFSIELPLGHLFESPTVAGVAQAIEKGDNGTLVPNQGKDLRAEAILDPKIQSLKYGSEPKNVFLTGATGFLGVYLLSELLEQTQGDIYCLVRSPDADRGKQRLQSSLEFYGLWKETKSSRIIPVIGDLSAPQLGLDKPRFKDLASQVDVIYHNGAGVNFVLPYSVLKPANVGGTQEVLRLASQTKIKPVHFISTMGVFSSSAYADKKVIFESDSLDYSPDNNRGYDESKWVAEKLVMEARDRGLPVCIYRPGRITGHSQTGVCKTKDFFCRIIKGCIQLGAAPNLEGISSDIIPVDYVSKAIVHISEQKESLGKAFHLVNPHDISVNELFNSLGSWGYSIEQIDYEKWRTKLINQGENCTVPEKSENALYPLLPLFSEEFAVRAKRPKYDCQNTLHGLAGTDIVCPSVGSKLLNTYFSYLIGSGFLKAP